MTRATPAPAADPALVEDLRGIFARTDYAAEPIRTLLGGEGELLTQPAKLPIQLHRLKEATQPLASLVSLFVLDQTIEPETAEPIFAPAQVSDLVESGILVEDDGALRSGLRIIPHDDVLIASDRTLPAVGFEHVAGVQRPSAGLAHLTVRRPVERALDVGTGTGIQAILAARHADHVVATDVSERALAFVALNAALNGVDNIELRQGSFFEPVAGEQFDLVICNPPYAITPDTSYLYRDGGLGGDGVAEHVVRELPKFLEKGAYGSTMLSWIREGDDPSERLRPWLDGSGCDAWILNSGTDDPLETTAAWNREVQDPEELSTVLDRWLAYYEEQSIEAISYGALVLRRRTGDNWVRTAEAPRSGINRAGPHLERLFSAQDMLRDRDDGSLLSRRFRFHESARLTHGLRPQEAGWSLESAELSLDTGLGFRAGLDEATSEITVRLDPALPLDEVLAAAAQALGVDAERLRTVGVGFVRRLIEFGYVIPAEE